MFQFCVDNDSVSRVKLDLSRKETFGRCKFRFGILAIIVVTEFEWTLLTTTLQLLLRANLWMLLLLSVGEFVTVIVNAESNAQVCLSTNWNDLILEAAMCNVQDVLIMSPMQGHTQTWSSLVKYKFVLVCRSGPRLVPEFDQSKQSQGGHFPQDYIPCKNYSLYLANSFRSGQEFWLFHP